MKKIPGQSKFPRAGKSFQTPTVKNKVGSKKKNTILGKSKIVSMIKLLIFLFLLATAARSSAQGSAKQTLNSRDSVTPTHTQDSIARLNAFVKEFGDTATISRFQMWLFKNLTAEQYQNFSATLQQYYGGYISQRYNEYLQKPKTNNKPKQ